MAGAGSSFSQSRRPGWESAYVDYETLKLLLTHIELVYEQSNYDVAHSEESLGSELFLDNEDHRGKEPSLLPEEKHLFDDDKSASSFKLSESNAKKYNRRRRSSFHPLNKKRKNKIVHSDYRDQLFVDSDSSDAFGMNSSDVETYEKATIPSTANFTFDTNGLLYDLSLHDDAERTHLINGSNQLYQATGFRTDGSTSRSPLQLHERGRMNWATFSKIDESVTNVNMGGIENKSTPTYRSVTSRWRKKRRVPSHIQIAHAKARAITKRFLGLLSAEVEKVSLFVHARLGELADTIGSLRFANDEGDALGRSNSQYPLSDGGFHSSSSSSNGSICSSDSDDGIAPRMSFENSSKSDQRPFSPSISSKRKNRRRKSVQDSRSDIEGRQSKPLFQRSDAVFGEDMSLLSAVDEADGYAAVGIELIHLLRFIMVNTLAVRKLCIKHDRLLANRMLGGYHYKEVKRLLQNDDFDQPQKLLIRKDSISEYDDFSTRGHGKAFTDFRREFSLRLQSNQNKLVGLFDSKLQELMTSATSLSLSESMRQALYEYEVSMCRAHALSNLNGSKKKSPIKAQKLSFNENVLCRYFVTPRFNFKSRYKDNKSISLTQGDESVFDEEDDDSTASTSTVSLIRLRFVVASILGWQEASRATQSNFQSFLARTMLLYDLNGHIAGDRQGFYGCSRETLDFLMSYNSDLPLIMDDYKHMLRALQSSQLDELMLACLATSSGSQSNMIDVLNEFHAVVFQEKICLKDRILGDIDSVSYRYLFIAFTSLLCSTMNIYIIVPSAFSSALRFGQDFFASLLLIASSTVGAIFSMLIQTYITTLARHDDYNVIHGSSYAINCFLFISMIGFVGNLIFSYASSTNHYILTIVGRFFIGMTFCEPITLSVVSSSAKITHVSAAAVYLKASSAIGLILGLLIGSIVYTSAFTVILDDFDVYINCDTIYGLILCGLWTLIFGSVISLFLLIPKRGKYSPERNATPVNVATNIDSPGSSDSTFQEDDTEGHSQHLTPFRKLHKLTADSENLIDLIDRRHSAQSSSNLKKFITNWSRAMKIVFRSNCLPVCFLMLMFSSAMIEIILTSFCLTMSHHFGWNFRLSGLCLTALSVLFMPSIALVHYFTEFMEERLLMKNCIVPIISLTMSLLYLPDACSMISKAVSQNPEDWCTSATILSVLLIFLGSSFIFVGCTLIQHAALSIVSKTSSSKLNRNPINCGILKSTAFLIGKLFGNVLLVLAWVTYRLTGVDFMNFIAISFVIMMTLSYQSVKKNYFFLSN